MTGRLTGSQASPEAAEASSPSGFDPGRKWTPGPWSVAAYPDGASLEVEGADSRMVAVLHWYDGDWPDQQVAEANARLIAAAPELYEAAEDFLAVWTEADQPDVEARAAISLGRALRKARGETA